MRRLVFLWLFAPLVLSQNYDKLPDWAALAMKSAATKEVPDADVWRVFDSTSIKWVKGQLHLERRLVQVVLKDRGSDEASVFLVDGDDQTRSVKKLKGWHLRANGKLDRLDRDNVITVGNASNDLITRDTTTLAVFEHVSKGSVVVFESNERENSYLGPVFNLGVLDSMPILKRTITVSADGGKHFELMPLKCEAWGLTADVTSGSVTFQNLPALEDTFLLPERVDDYPRVFVKLHGEPSIDARYESWDAFAAWYAGAYASAAGVSLDGHGASSFEEIADLMKTVQQRVRYKQVYLSPSSGWQPHPGKEVFRKAYGDCKDMVSCLSEQAKQKQIAVLPVLASVDDGPNTGPDSPVSPAFNHLIAAVPLTQSLGLDSEFQAGGKRYLLLDPTSKNTPVGKLAYTYKGRSVLVCSPQGAIWHQIEDKTLESGEVKVRLEGGVDTHCTFTGLIQIQEWGNTYGLRALIDNKNNPLEVERGVRWALDIPNTTIMSLRDQKVNDGVVTLTYEMSWASFLRRDAYGYRLPYAVIQAPRATLTRADSKRWEPIEFGFVPKVTWDVVIDSPVRLEPGEGNLSWEGAHRSFSWQAKMTHQLTVHYELWGNEHQYFADEREHGVQAWAEYRKTYNDFYKSATLLIP